MADRGNRTTLVAGVDSSTQSCKVVIRDADTGTLVRSGRAPHPEGTEVDPRHWWTALQEAVAEAGGLDDVAALAVGGQQHGMVALDADGRVVRDALLWNDTRSAAAASDLITELGNGDVQAGAAAWADAVGSVPVASLTVTKLRWLVDHEPERAARVAAVALPHDWLTWRLSGASSLENLATDRSDASGTGYWSPRTESYRTDLLIRALGHDAVTPRVLGPHDPAGGAAGPPQGSEVVLGPGAGDNAAAALALGMRPGDVAVSIGTSGAVSAVTLRPAADPTGLVNGFADATGHYLPLCCTLNASRVLDATSRLLGVDLVELSRLALSASPGAGGLVVVPYLEGERTPNRPHATGAVHGLRLANATRQDLARAAVEGVLCALADGLDLLTGQAAAVERLLLVGGGARSEAVRRIAPLVFGRDVVVPPAGEYVADGAARQAAWTLSGHPDPPAWSEHKAPAVYSAPDGGDVSRVRNRYAEAREHTIDRPDG